MLRGLQPAVGADGKVDGDLVLRDDVDFGGVQGPGPASAGQHLDLRDPREHDALGVGDDALVHSLVRLAGAVDDQVS